MRALKAESDEAAQAGRALRKLYLTLFLRGRTSKGLTPKAVPTSIGQKIGLILAFYCLVGFSALIFVHGELFMLSAYLHGITFALLGMFLVMSAGETLFDKDEIDILSHRPISPKTLLWAKISVLLQVCFYLSLSLNLAGLFIGLTATDGNWSFPIVHFVTITEEGLFCGSSVVLVYQLCLRWFGRERLDNLMTAMQVLMMFAFIGGSQILPRIFMINQFHHTKLERPWWLYLIPPTWFAGLDDAVAGSRGPLSWRLAIIGLIALVLVVWLAFGKLSRSYEEGLQKMTEATTQTPRQNKQFKLLNWLVGIWPIKRILKDSVSQTAFILVVAHLWRDRETKLRVYPTMASVLVMPFIMMLSNPTAYMDRPHFSIAAEASLTRSINDMMLGMAIAFGGALLGSIPLTAINLLTYSQQWKASEVFHFAPIPGPWPIQRGVIVAVNVLLVLPMLLLLVAFALFEHALPLLPLLLLGILPVPLFSRLPALILKSIPLSRPSEESKALGRGCFVIIAPFLDFGIAGLGLGARAIGLLPEMLVVEALVVVALCIAIDRKLARTPWQFAD